MGLFRLLLSPILVPINGGLAVARKIREASELEYFNEGKIKAALVALSDSFDAGEIDEATFESEEEILIERFQVARSRARQS